jgi:transcriptional regulator GlxA family with amidase domain
MVKPTPSTGPRSPVGDDTVETGSVKRIGFLVFPEFSMMALASASEPLRAANRLLGVPSYDWTVLSSTGGPISSSSGFMIDTTPVAQAPKLDRMFVVASMNIEALRDAEAFRFIKRLAVTDVTLGALSNGTIMLARAGVLDGYRCTLHWENLRQFSEEFPTIEVCREIYVRDRNRWTCAGGTAAIDLMLDQVTTDCGGQLAAAIADQFLHGRIRQPQETQRMQIQWRYGIPDKRVNAAILLMEAHLETPLEIQDIAVRCHLSLRHMERLWHKYFDMGPQRFYLSVRLKEAQRLLKESTESLSSIAMRCGFASPSHLGSTYRRAFGCSPGEERRAPKPG